MVRRVFNLTNAYPICKTWFLFVRPDPRTLTVEDIPNLCVSFSPSAVGDPLFSNSLKLSYFLKLINSGIMIYFLPAFISSNGLYASSYSLSLTITWRTRCKIQPPLLVLNRKARLDLFQTSDPALDSKLPMGLEVVWRPHVVESLRKRWSVWRLHLKKICWHFPYGVS